MNTISVQYITQQFELLYRTSPTGVCYTPYRVCPLGAHVDHQLGKVTGFAIDKGIYLAYKETNNGEICVSSLQFDGSVSFSLHIDASRKQNDWADHLRGAVCCLASKYELKSGLCGVINGELPIGGLSSSAAVIITFLSALCKINGITLAPNQMLDIAKEAENRYVGVNCGKLDQACEIYCRKNRLLYFDTLDDSIRLIEAPQGTKPFKLAVFFSGIERSLANSGYNKRVDECRSAAYALKAFAGMPYGKYDETNLRDVPEEIYLQYKNKLPVDRQKRAEHWYGEMNRVQRGVNAYAQGDIDTFGKLVFESGKSSIEKYEAGSPELIKMYEIMTHTKGIYGGRFSGAGFKGCSVALINPDYQDEVLDTMKREYLKAFPHLSDKYDAFICETENGVENA